VLFHTWTFALFFLVVWPVHLAVKGTRWRDAWLLFASYAFYAWWNPLYLLLIAFSTVVDYSMVTLMARTIRPGPRKAFLAASITTNLSLLAMFKYAGLATDSLNALLSWMGASYSLPAPGFLLPVGISFYTFRSMTYTIDFYRGILQRERSIIRYAAFVSLFPMLLAGPIERAGRLLTQMRAAPRVLLEDVTDGASLLVVGLFKKIALADYLAMYVDKVYAAPGDHQAAALALATFAFGWQVYFDFSGYTDMARGAARMMGFRLMLNFNHPYLATSLRDFWNRWHISLSSWFKDYLYIPLGGNRGGRLGTYRNMILTMVICGLWHGAAWTFVVWGLMHALGRAVTRELEATTFYARCVPRLAKQAMVFVFVTFAWIFFRAHSIEDASLIVTRMFTTGWADPGFPLPAGLLILAVWAYQFACESRLRWVLTLAPVRMAGVTAMILYMAVVAGGGSQPFYYFQF